MIVLLFIDRSQHRSYDEVTSRRYEDLAFSSDDDDVPTVKEFVYFLCIYVHIESEEKMAARIIIDYRQPHL